ncbi:MAG: hypothetical protein CEE40_03665 [Chloroflexi bacterium B3_Chlor]|nr:MAG: hypothetical protein CEE40_03665 [Chloroflexi bacterium B3_Chlor]
MTYAEAYDVVLAYMRRRRFEDVDRLADRIAETTAGCLSAGLDTASTVEQLMRLNSHSFSLNRVSKAQFLSDIERHVRAQVQTLPLGFTAPSLRQTILQLLDVDDSAVKNTQVFRGKNHDILLRHFAKWLRGRMHELGLSATSAVSQGPSDQGVDAIMEVTNGVAGRVGIQLENDTTIRKNDFNEQMARVYGLYDINEVDLLIIVFCGDETNRSVQMKVRHQIAIAAQKKDRNLITIEPTKALSILGPHLES